MNFNLKGTGVALITPFLENGKIDYNSLEKVTEHIINGGVEYIVVLGTTGETGTLEPSEKKEIYSTLNRIVGGRLPLVAGLGGNNTAELINQIQEFDVTGYSAILSVSPYYNKPNQTGIYQHFVAVSKVSPLPLIIYNVPGRTGSNITAETTLRISTHVPNIAGIKEASGNFEQCMDIINQKKKSFHVISGDDALTFPFIAAGMSGVISVIANAYPLLFSKMVRFALNGQMQLAQELHYKLYDLSKLIFSEGSPGGIKYILYKMGLCQNTVRLPLWPISESLEKKIDFYMEKITS